MSNEVWVALLAAITVFFCVAAIFAAGAVFYHMAAWVFETFGVVAAMGFIFSSMAALSVFIAFAAEKWWP